MAVNTENDGLPSHLSLPLSKASDVSNTHSIWISCKTAQSSPSHTRSSA